MSAKATIKGNLGIVAVKDIPVVSSREVAKEFEKQHKNVMQAINNLECSAKFNELNFQPVTYKDAHGQKRPEYLMTKDGFTFLALAFTGKKAAAFREAYIAEFNRMEEAIKTRLIMKANYQPLMDAVYDSHDNPQFYHYSNEADLINRLVLFFFSSANEKTKEIFFTRTYSIVAVKDIPVVSSREVAEAFEREHRNVLRDIRNLKPDGEEFWLLNFEERKYKNRGKLYPEFRMTRDGFLILTMGFTGKKAMQQNQTG